MFRAKSVNDGEPSYSASFLIDPTTKIGKANIAKMEDAIDYVIGEKWPKKAPKLPESKLCLRDGNEKEFDGYEDMMYVSASNKKKPLTVDFDKEEVSEADNVLYSGCYVGRNRADASSSELYRARAEHPTRRSYLGLVRPHARP